MISETEVGVKARSARSAVISSKGIAGIEDSVNPVLLRPSHEAHQIHLAHGENLSYNESASREATRSAGRAESTLIHLIGEHDPRAAG